MKLLEEMEIQMFVIGKETTEPEVEDAMQKFRRLLFCDRNVVLVIRKGSLVFAKKVIYENDYSMMREDIIRHIVKFNGNGQIISTIGKASRQLF